MRFRIKGIIVSFLAVFLVIGCTRSDSHSNQSADSSVELDKQALETNLTRLIQSDRVKNSDFIRANSITLESVGQFFPEGNEGKVSFGVRWMSDGAAGFDSAGSFSGKWTAYLRKAGNGQWYITQVVTRSGDQALEVIDTEFEIR